MFVDKCVLRDMWCTDKGCDEWCGVGSERCGE